MNVFRNILLIILKLHNSFYNYYFVNILLNAKNGQWTKINAKRTRKTESLLDLFWRKKVTFEGGFKYEDRPLQVTRWVARGEFSRVEHISISRAIGAGK